ncbi:AAA family ATPase [Quadrisphaera sp. INWT6]|uniref:AAA family ATPase n=1 Tax=Quadrisphaera sp. INWT6 TaxID=2596917 RepID=UPI00189238C4|nr:AAA family ATPase [Quadrisphaera sp. INWT6]MBF5080363.1 hypothetical protein [Quadrisphaera sp. INWT6]
MSQTDAPAQSSGARQGTGTGPLTALRRYARSSAAIVVVAGIASAAVGVLLAPAPSARAVIELSTPSSSNLLAPGSANDATLTRYTAQRAAFVESDPVLEQVVGAVGGLTVQQLRGIVTVSTSAGSNTLDVGVAAATPERSELIAGAVVDAYRAQTTAQVDALTDAALSAVEASADEQREQLQLVPTGPAASAAATTLAGLAQQANELRTDRAVFGDGVEFARTAVVPAPGPPLREVALGLVVGLGLATAVAWLRADRDPRVEDEDGAALASGTAPLGTVSDDGPLRTLRGLPGPTHTPLASALVVTAADGVLLVTSARRGEGRTTTAANLAAAAAREGRRVLLVDADLSRSTLSLVLGARSPGGAEVRRLLYGDAEQWADVAPVPRYVDPAHFVHVVVAGAGGRDDTPADLARLRTLVEGARAEFDLVVVDAEPLLGGGVPAVLARLSDAAVLVVRKGTSQAAVRRASQLLDLYGTPVRAVLLTAASSHRRQRRARLARPLSSPRRPLAHLLRRRA